MAGAEFLGDLQVGGLVLVGGAQDKAEAADECLRSGVSADQALEVLSLLVGKDEGGCVGCRHGSSPMFEAELAFLLSAIRTPTRPGYEKLPRDLRNAVLSDRVRASG